MINPIWGPTLKFKHTEQILSQVPRIPILLVTSRYYPQCHGFRGPKKKKKKDWRSLFQRNNELLHLFVSFVTAACPFPAVFWIASKMASIGQDEVWVVVHSVLEQSHPSGASHARRNPSLRKTKVLTCDMTFPEFKSKKNVGDSDVNVLSKRIEDTKVKCLN